MLTAPPIHVDRIAGLLRDAYGVEASQVSFLPVGGDANSAVYRAAGPEGDAYFLKLRLGDFDEVAALVPAFLHGRGITQVVAPMATRAGAPWLHADGFDWMLYPFVAGEDGFRRPLTSAQWAALGAGLRAVHATVLPDAIARRVPREDYSPRWRHAVRAFDAEVTRAEADRNDLDGIAREFVALWAARRDEIRLLVQRAEDLAAPLHRDAGPPVLCHTDLHAGNVLAGADGALGIVDWDNPLFAPKERDLMFIGGGVGGAWNREEEAALFYAGYGPAEVDRAALSYFRYERIVTDLALMGPRIFGTHDSTEERRGLLPRLMRAFDPGNVVEMAHRSYPGRDRA